MLYVYLLPAMIKRLVWRRVATVAGPVNKRVNGDESTHTLYTRTKGKTLTRSDSAGHL